MTTRHEGLAQGQAICSPLKKVFSLPSPDSDSCRVTGSPFLLTGWESRRGAGGGPAGASSAVGRGECEKHGAGQEPTGAELGGGQGSSPVLLERGVWSQVSMESEAQTYGSLVSARGLPEWGSWGAGRSEGAGPTGLRLLVGKGRERTAPHTHTPPATRWAPGRVGM